MARRPVGPIDDAFGLNLAGTSVGRPGHRSPGWVDVSRYGEDANVHRSPVWVGESRFGSSGGHRSPVWDGENRYKPRAPGHRSPVWVGESR